MAQQPKECDKNRRFSHLPLPRLVSRRHFLKETLIGAAGGMLIAGGLHAGADPDERHKGNQMPKSAKGHIARVSADESACASCGMCALVCAAVHGHAVGPSTAGIWLDRDPFACEYLSIVCHQCDAPECFFACETEGAFYIEETTGARAIDSEKCIGCGDCMEACVFETSRIQMDKDREVALKCDLCAGRPEGPACVQYCPRQALQLIKEG